MRTIAYYYLKNKNFIPFSYKSYLNEDYRVLLFEKLKVWNKMKIGNKLTSLSLMYHIIWAEGFEAPDVHEIFKTSSIKFIPSITGPFVGKTANKVTFHSFLFFQNVTINK